MTELRGALRPTILAALDAHAERAPDAPAIDSLTYGALRTGSERVAAALRRRGIAPGDRMVLYAENSHAFVYAYLGALRAGAVVVPANVLYREADLTRVLEDSGAAAIAFSEQSRAFVPASAASGIALSEIAAWACDASFDTLASTQAPPPGADDLAVLIYTSGTTGRAKGAMLTHGNLAAIANQVNDAWQWTASDCLLLTLPLFHVHGLCAGLNGTLAAGGRLLLRERFIAEDVAATLAAGDVTLFFGVPTMYVRLLESAPHAFNGVRLFVSGSAALPASVHDAFAERFGASILERYGSTEFGFALTNRYAGARHAGTVGFPFPGVSVRLIGPDDQDVPLGEIGEIAVSGPNVCAGYWGNAEATSAAFFLSSDGSRWFRSGDLATFDPERGYAIVGRTKELIISGGFNIYPREIEDELALYPGVRAAAVIGASDPARGELPVAFIEADDAVDDRALLAHLRTRIASFKVPKALYRIDALPRNAMGKIDKPQLRDELARRAGTEASDVVA
jgi:malonyl-CoA/methylmalonyl-CoA synthetase